MADIQASNIVNDKLLQQIQTQFIDKINGSFEVVQGFASSLLYTIIVIELVVFGLAWAFQSDNAFGLLILKTIKIGIFVGIINYFPYLLQVMMNGFTFVGYQVGSEKSAIYLFNPGKIWEIGFETGASMLKLAIEYGSYNVGMSFLYLFLGFGVLLLFAAISAQVILVVSLFYIMAMFALLAIPFGAFKPLENFFYKAIQGLIKAGVRVFVVIIILGVAFALWESLKIQSVGADATLEKPLGLFFATFILMILMYRIPGIVADAVGTVGGDLFQGFGHTPETNVSVNSSQPAQAMPAASSIQAGVSNVSSGGSSSDPGSSGGTSSVAAASAVTSAAPTGGGGGSGNGGSGASSVSVSTSGMAAAMQSSKPAGLGGASQVGKSNRSGNTSKSSDKKQK